MTEASLQTAAFLFTDSLNPDFGSMFQAEVDHPGEPGCV